MTLISPNLATGPSIYFTGRKFRNASIVGVNPTGSSLTRLSGVDLAQVLLIDSVEFEEELELVEVSSANALMKNYVPKKADFTVTMSEFINSEGFPNVLYAFKNYLYVLIEICISQSADAQYAANGGPVGFTIPVSDGTIIQCPCIIQSTRYGFSENQEAAIFTGKPMGLPLEVIGPGGGLVYP